MKKILSFLAVLGLLIASAPAYALTSGLYLGGQTYTLAGSGISSSASSLTLTSLTLPQNGYKIRDADLDSTFHVTVEPGNRTRQEFVDCTTVVQNGTGTATLSGCTRGMSGIFPYTASTTQAFSHSGGSTVVFSNTPSLYYDLIQYANSLAIAGAPDATTLVKGISELATQAETALGTANGGVGPLVIPNSTATSTYNSATAANRVIVSGVGGKIDPNFIDFSTGSFTFATTSINIGAFPAWQIGKQTQVFSSTGTTTFTVPSGITKIWVGVQAAGGGGGVNGTGSGSSGAAGGYTEGVVDITGTTTIQVFVGSGGAGSVGTGSGVAGSWSTFGTNGFYVYATGGAAGVQGGGGVAGGVGVGGQVNISGQDGADGLTTSNGRCGTGGTAHMGGGARMGAASGNYGGGGGCNAAAGNAGAGAQGIVTVRW